MKSDYLFRLAATCVLLVLGGSCARTGKQERRCIQNSDCSATEICAENICTFNNAVQVGEIGECLDTQVTNENNECVQCVANLDCDDGNPCNGAEVCLGETCIPGADPCLRTPEQDICEPADNAAGYVCVRVQCVSDVECGTQAPFCEGGACVACRNDSDCTDEDLCNGDETCDDNNECSAGEPVACSDGDACNGLETCESSTGSCVIGTDPCDDTETVDLCVTTDDEPGYVCQEVGCLEDNNCSGETPYCSENNICVACLNNGQCDDEALCNGVETCNDNNECLPGEAVVCSDGNACNGDETCEDTTGACLPGADPCLATNTVDICVTTDNTSGYICQAVGCLSNADCVDDDLCNGTESCDMATNECVVGADNVICEDDLACNGIETCEANTGECLPGVPVCEDSTYCEEDPVTGTGYTCQEVGLLQLQAGGDKNCGVSKSNQLFCWGSNLNGAIVPEGDGFGGYTEPLFDYFGVAIEIAAGVQRVAVGRNDDGDGNHLCYIYGEGTSTRVYCQGSQVFGMLGDGEEPDLADDYLASYLSAGDVVGLPAQEYTDISAGSAHTCVVSATGKLYCWGFSAQGQTGGEAYYENAQSTPALVSGFPADTKVLSVGAGLLHTCVITANATEEAEEGSTAESEVYCFGSNADYQLGHDNATGICEDVYLGGDIDCESVPQKVSFPGAVDSVSQVCGGYNYSCALTEPDGTVYCWGDFYQQGLASSYPTPIPEATTQAKEIACGMQHVCVLKDDGSVTCFGAYETYDVLLDEYYLYDIEPAPLNNLYPEIDTDTVEHISAGKQHSCFSTNDPQTFCWGYWDAYTVYDFYWALLDL